MSNVITASIADVFSRPADDNYDSMDRLLEVAEEEMNQSREVATTGGKIKFAFENGFQIDIENGKHTLPLTNYSMTQSAAMAKIPTNVLERLYQRERSDLVVDNLNTLFENNRAKDKFVLVRDTYNEDGTISSIARAMNGGDYSRLWDYEVFAEMQDFLIPLGFTPNLPKLRSEAMRNGLMHNLDTGLFRGDQCSFGFFFVEQDLIGDSSSLGGLKPGMMVFNSEVGARSFGYHTFYYHEKSGNIIIWTPSRHGRKRFVHRGNIQKAFREYVATLEDVANNFQARYTEDLATFEMAMTTEYAKDKDAAVQKLNKDLKIAASTARAIVSAAGLPQNKCGNDLSVWNIALGIAWEAGQTGRAESLVDNTLVATKMMRSILKV
jgi:uncharacterized protein YihD (DUF1040 family)